MARQQLWECALLITWCDEVSPVGVAKHSLWRCFQDSNVTVSIWAGSNMVHGRKHIFNQRNENKQSQESPFWLVQPNGRQCWVGKSHSFSHSTADPIYFWPLEIWIDSRDSSRPLRVGSSRGKCNFGEVLGGKMNVIICPQQLSLTSFCKPEVRSEYGKSLELILRSAHREFKIRFLVYE